MRRYEIALVGCAAVLAGCGGERTSAPAASGAAAPAAFADLLSTPVGEVDFPVGCAGEAAALAERGVAFLHHMMYAQADFVFGLALDADPDCAIAYWGQAMTIIHPLWADVPDAEALARGARLSATALGIGGHDPREDAYLETTRAYFENGEARTEAERLRSFDVAWGAVATANPEDLEAAAFYALAHLATADPSDLSFARQRQTGAMAERVLAASPNHPGAHHYIIHSYDSPALAPRALPVANAYGRLAPKVPHATHMMTHIYTRLGLWEESIEWNLASAEAGWELCTQSGVIFNDYPHALDYLAYAYLQRGEDERVLDILETASELQPPYSDINRNASAYAFAALPARYALERRDWEAAARLEPRTPASFPWTADYDAYVAITHFARAIGLARLGRVEDARREIDMLRELEARVEPLSAYWAKQVAIQAASAEAWLAYAEGDVDGALAHMRRAAALEATTEKHAVTPGEILPAAELLGDLLLEAGRVDEALAAYRDALARSPGRHNGLYGAGRAALMSGDEDAARAYLSELAALAGDAPTPRPTVTEAAAWLEEL
jgi:tetratricopeptide (TPR) repeat protein